LGTDGARENSTIPEAAFADASHQLKTTSWQRKSLVDWSETGLDFRRSDGVWRQVVREGLDADVLVTHADRSGLGARRGGECRIELPHQLGDDAEVCVATFALWVEGISKFVPARAANVSQTFEDQIPLLLC